MEYVYVYIILYIYTCMHISVVSSSVEISDSIVIGLNLRKHLTETPTTLMMNTMVSAVTLSP